MHVMELLHKTFRKELPFVHKLRLNNVMCASAALIQSNKLTLTSLGRNFSGQCKVRSNIKKMDRLLGNTKLQSESVQFYKLINSYLINENANPIIHVDWSHLCTSTGLLLLRAAFSMKGRAITIYEECHPNKNHNNHIVHKEFLNQLKNILPVSVKPVLVTDAGFRGKWFAYVRKIGWDFVGRLRNKNAVKLAGQNSWGSSQSMYAGAKTGVSEFIGKGILTHAEKVFVKFVRYKGRKIKRQYKARYRAHGTSSTHYVKSSNEPWILVTSLPDEDISKKTVNTYRQRMQIEENFRDTKCTRYGFGLKESRSRTVERMNVLLLIAAITSFVCWIAASITKNNGNASDYQAHSSKYKSILSYVYLGREVLRRKIQTCWMAFHKAISELSHLAAISQAAYEEI